MHTIAIHAYLVSSFTHHLLSPGLPDGWYSDYPVEVGGAKRIATSLKVPDKELILEVLEYLGNDINQVELLTI